MNSPKTLLKQGLEQLGLDIKAETQTKLISFQEKMLETNTRLNLTSIKDPDQAVVKHLLDSLSALKLEALAPQGNETWLDLGAGGGLPGFPLAIARPEIKMAMVEATQKKAAFLEQVAQELDLAARIKVYPERSEKLARGKLRESLQLVVARGVGPVRVLVELALPFLEKGGVLVAYKGPRADEELKDAAKAFHCLGARLVDRLDFQLPIIDEKRVLLVIKKMAATHSEYPRLAGTPAKEPL